MQQKCTKFPERLTELREGANLSRQQLADILGVSRASLEYYEKGKRTPDIDVLYKLSEHFNVTSDYLIGRTDKQGESTDINAICNYTGLSEKAVNSLHSIISKGAINTFFEKEIYFMQVITLFDMYRLDYEKYVKFKEKFVTDNVVKQDINKLKEIAYNSINLKDKVDLSEYKLTKAFEALIKQCVNSLIERENKVNDNFEYFDYFASSKTLECIEEQLFGEKLLEGEFDNGND